MAFSKLPDDVISQIISLTTPRDACRVSSVSTSFRSIADSDQVWLKFLPPDHDKLVLPQVSPKKSLYLHLCDHPVPIGGNRNMVSARFETWSEPHIFSLDKKSAKKCFMIGARELAIPGGDDYRSWCWIAEPNSRFDQVAQLLFAGWFHIKARLETKMLSPKTRYAAYLVFQFRCHKSGFHRPAVSCVSVESDTDTHREWPTVVLDPGEGEPRSTRERGDGWLEIEMGEFYNENGDDGTLECSFKEVDEYTLRSGLVVEGIELRPKETY
ncbi:F-box protein PP2-B11-like [Eucalyptus grandis]|uniref:F-box protein PP2-B11-like n=1 Tax=Eucalyptus grandis TaxID=71139 RepID=UPI00192ED140|nr:F-box protein PP2-B11-like [Eucalyptus grandis]